MPRIRTHSGEVLQEEFLTPLDMSASELARHIGVPANRVTETIRERRGVTADTAIRVARFFKTTPEFWLNMQQAHDMSKALAEHDYSAIEPRAAAG